MSTNINIGKTKSKKKNISQTLSYNDFIKESILESNQRETPNQFLGYVREVIQYQNAKQDFFFTNTDPFHSHEVNEKRMKNAGFIKNYRQITYIFVEIPALYNNMFSSEQRPQVTLFSLARVDVTDLKRKPSKGDVVYVKFKSPASLSNPVFDGFKQDAKGRTVVKSDSTEPFKIQGKVFGITEEEV